MFILWQISSVGGGIRCREWQEGAGASRGSGRDCARQGREEGGRWQENREGKDGGAADHFDGAGHDVRRDSETFDGEGNPAR